MQTLVKRTLYLFLWITGLTALLALSGLVYLWFFSQGTQPHETKDLPHLGWLVSAVIAEIVAVVLLLAKKGLKYLPETQTDKNSGDTIRFMQNFISSGTSATIVSNRVSWLASNSELIEILKDKAKAGIRIEIITPHALPDEIRDALAGVSFIVTKETNPPEARFTLINGDRSGAERLAIARGVHPEHEITIFDNNSGPQISTSIK
ncbi:hypothetical protein [Allochromatium palmeri]|uniref:Uncharacterized protein n=1 Tax=Allochromatium palmeri TaxID=231048 RepID=A0A6N8EG81_9GAMM|nr:hypothetical protein [Allochromatium palmeri]MTW21839.1 hypothetical protein [Allochromatium palmeri]